MHKLRLVCGAGVDLREAPPEEKNRAIAVLMSGGVDSSVCALKLREEGWAVVGVNMIIPLACGGKVETDSVKDVCRFAGITLYQLEAAEIFNANVIEHFRNEYGRGRTPNPCCDCNRELKFGALWNIIEEELGILHLATGHYASVERENGQTLLRRGAAREKDQSYFIYGLPPARLPYFHLPLADMCKDETRSYAAAANLPVAQKSESMELCFAGAGDYRVALTGTERGAGDFVDSGGKILGRHEGIELYTPGQRKLGRSFGAEPFFVLQVLPDKNQVVVGPRVEIERTLVRGALLVVHQPTKLAAGAKLWGKIRSPGEPVACLVLEYQVENGGVAVEFARPLFAPATGQHLVLYDETQAIVAGGTIEG